MGGFSHKKEVIGWDNDFYGMKHCGENYD